MANQITDNRTAVEAFDVTTNAVDLGGAGAGTQDVDVFIEGTASVGDIITNSRSGIMYNAGAAQNWSSNVFYIWINCGIVGLLDTKANAGFTIRFCGATVTNWFEVYVGGSDSWPSAVQGGWVQFVVDIEDARAAAIVGTVGGVNGTTPATSAIQYVGWSGITAGTMTKMVDNTWVDEIRRLPDGTPGIIIEGRNGGVTDWNSADITTQLGVSVGTFILTSGGAYKLDTPIQFGINDTTVHGFTDTNAIWLWDDQEFAPADLYSLSALGNVGGTTNVTLGVKTGTGDNATGSQGAIISAAAAGVRWSMVFDDPNIDGINLYGCTCIHGGDFQLDDVAVSSISTQYIDCSSATVSGSEQLRISVIDANTVVGVAFMTTDDMTDIKYSVFQFSAGHAIELTTPIVASQTSLQNTFTGYGADATTDAAVYNNTAGAVTLGISGGDTPTVRNGTSASTTINNSVTLTVTGVTEGTAVKVIANETVGSITIGDIIFELLADSTGTASLTTFNYEAAFDPSGLDVIVRTRQQGLPNFAISETTGSVFVDETTNANSSVVDDMNLILAAPVAGDDWYYVGHEEQFNRIKLDISTAGTGGFLLDFEYWNGAAWTNLAGVVDGTSNYTITGENIISWTLPGDWGTTSVNANGPVYYIRIGYLSGTLTVAPLGRKCKLDVTRYLPFTQNNIITSTGLTVTASWAVDSISKFDDND